MATLTIRLNGYPEILDKLLINELESFIEQLNEDASVFISIKEGGAALMFTGVEESKRSEITLKADEVIKAYLLNS